MNADTSKIVKNNLKSSPHQGIWEVKQVNALFSHMFMVTDTQRGRIVRDWGFIVNY